MHDAVIDVITQAQILNILFVFIWVCLLAHIKHHSICSNSTATKSFLTWLKGLDLYRMSVMLKPGILFSEAVNLHSPENIVGFSQFQYF